MRQHSAGDGLHTVAISADGHLEPACDFSYDEIDERLGWAEQKQESVSWDDMSSAFAILLGWICQKNLGDKPATTSMVGARAESLLLLLDPNQSKYKTMADIAAAAGCTRAALSKHLLSLKDQISLAISAGKPGYFRDSCRRAQEAAVAAGIHASTKTRRKTASSPRLDAVGD